MRILLDAGHGGIINGEYQTPGKRSPIWKDGSQLFEGEFNRHIMNGVARELLKLGVDYVKISDSENDMSLEKRAYIANGFGEESILISFHSNAGGGSGFECYTYYGESGADRIADEFYKEFENEFPMHKIRTDYTDGDSDKESGFYILKNTVMPSILLEMFFMDNEHECREILLRDEGRARIIKFVVKSILNILKK